MNLAAEHAAGSIVLAVVGGIKYSIVNSSIQYHSPQPVLSPSTYLAAVLQYAILHRCEDYERRRTESSSGHVLSLILNCPLSVVTLDKIFKRSGRNSF